MSAPPYMQLYVADYLGDTRHLTTEQHGAYLLLLMAMWRAGGRLPNEAPKLARIVGLSANRWAKLETDVLAFFDVDDGSLIHARVEKELEKYTRTATKRKAAGAKGGEAKSLKNNDAALANATILLEQNASNCRHISEPEPEPDTTTVANAPVVCLMPKTAGETNEVWAARLKEAHAAAGDGANLTIGAMHTYADLRRLCEPTSGDPCLWAEVLDAVKAVSLAAIRKRDPIRSWTWVTDQALAFRDRRLAGLPSAKAPVPHAQGPPRQTLAEQVGSEHAAAKALALSPRKSANG